MVVFVTTSQRRGGKFGNFEKKDKMSSISTLQMKTPNSASKTSVGITKSTIHDITSNNFLTSLMSLTGCFLISRLPRLPISSFPRLPYYSEKIVFKSSVAQRLCILVSNVLFLFLCVTASENDFKSFIPAMAKDSFSKLVLVSRDSMGFTLCPQS